MDERTPPEGSEAGSGVAEATADSTTPSAPDGTRERRRKFPSFPKMGRQRSRVAPAVTPLPRRGAGMLGLELTRDGLRFVELRRSGRTVMLRSFGEVARDPAVDLGSVLTSLLREREIEARDVQIVDSVSRANLRIQTMPRIPDKELGLILTGEIASEADLLGEEMVGDWCPLHADGEDVDVLIGKIPLGERAAIEAACRSAGLRLRSLTTSSIVLARHLQLTGGVPRGETVAVLDTGRAKTNMALVSSDSIQLVREVYQGVSSDIFSGEPADATDLDAITAGLDEVVGTVQQIRRTWDQFREAQPGAVMHHVVMTGETTRVASLISLVQHDLQVPVETFDPSEHVDGSRLAQEFRETAAAYAVPWVLATTPTADIPLNFAEKIIDPRPVKIALGVAAAAVCGCLAVGTLQIRQRGAESDATVAMEAASAAKASVEVELGILEEVQQQWEGFLSSSVHAGGMPTPDPRPHLAELIRALPENIRLLRVQLLRKGEGLVLEADGRAVTQSAAANHKAMEEFVRALGESPLVRRISLRPIEYQNDRSRPEESGLEFSLSADVRLAVVGGPLVAPDAESQDGQT